MSFAGALAIIQTSVTVSSALTSTSAVVMEEMTNEVCS
jgi:hypothetical protein